jgi:phage tail-like protein
VANFSGNPVAGDELEDPLSLHHFGVEVDGIKVALFSECSAANREVGKFDYYATATDGSGKVYYQAVPGNTKYNTVTLKRGITSDNKLWSDWFQKVLEGDMKTARKTVTITGHSPDNKTVFSMTLHRAWMTKYSGPGWDAKTMNQAALETVELAHEGLTRVK